MSDVLYILVIRSLVGYFTEFGHIAKMCGMPCNSETLKNVNAHFSGNGHYFRGKGYITLDFGH